MVSEENLCFRLGADFGPEIFGSGGVDGGLGEECRSSRFQINLSIVASFGGESGYILFYPLLERLRVYHRVEISERT